VDTAALPPAFYGELIAAYGELAKHCGEDQLCVAVRSSAIDEDGSAASFAGQYETYLNVVGVEAIAEAITNCWASAGSERVMEYRQRYGLSQDDAQVAVLVQQLIHADVSAVVFSANPVNGNREEAVINASWGLGESIVGGTVTPDTYIVRKADGAVIDRQISEKLQMTVSVAGGTNEVGVPRFMRSQPALNDEQAVEMAGLASGLEEKLGWPVDIECAIHQGQLYLLQCRPITTLDQPE
jgi:pyruvate,water dikinase